MRLQVVVCSTRPGRLGYVVADWFAQAAAGLKLFEVELVDLMTFGLPIFDEPNHPRLGVYVHEHTRKWSASVSSADAFVFVTPEYNHAPPPSLVNALDFLSKEWNYKPAGFVSYGGISGGTRAVQVAKQMVLALRMLPVLEALAIPHIGSHIGSDGTFSPTDTQEAAIGPLVQELHRLARAHLPLRHHQGD
jgi:NAD(P)H-dependent FMN reductase